MNNNLKYNPTENQKPVLNEPAIEYEINSFEEKKEYVLNKLLALADKQIAEGDTITHEAFLLERKLRFKNLCIK